MGVKVISASRRSGPAAARYLGARHVTGEVLVFIDSDVAVHPDALHRIVQAFEQDPELDAVMGAYDDAPFHPGFVSQFKNLMHSFVHRQGNRRASTFWCGCGAVKRAVYLEHGGLDSSYEAIEDLEFGLRLHRSGRRLGLDPEIQGKHLKHWTLWNLLVTDVFLRGIPWTRLILKTRFMPDDLNLRWGQRVCVSLSGLLLFLAATAAWAIYGSNLQAALLCLIATLAALLAIAALNSSFYAFLAARRGWAFSLSAVPLHVLYYFYCGISFVLGCGSYLWKTWVYPEHNAARG